MILDFVLIITSFTALVMLWYRVSLKIPELIAVPDQVITERLEERSARLRLLLIRLKSLYREGQLRETFWNFSGKLLYRMHIALMRLDNGIVLLLKWIRARGFTVNGNGNGEHWKQLRSDSGSNSAGTQEADGIRAKDKPV